MPKKQKKQQQKLRDTRYAREIVTTAIGHTRLERILIKDTDTEEIRLSWWPQDRMANRPVDIPEEMFINLIAAGIKKGVLSPSFLSTLIMQTAQ